MSIAACTTCGLVEYPCRCTKPQHRTDTADRVSRTDIDGVKPTKPAAMTPAELHALKERAYKARCEAEGAGAGRAFLASLEGQSDTYVKVRCETQIESDAAMARLDAAKRTDEQRTDAAREARARAWNEQATRPEKWAEQSQKCADAHFGTWKPIADEE